MDIVLLAGEASGDQLGAALLTELRRLHPQLECAGIGGQRMRSAGFDAWWGVEELSVMGLFEVVRHLPRLLRLRRLLIKKILARRPDLVIGIDAPDFNLGVEKRVRRRGIKTLHYVSPTVWAWRPDRARTIGASADLVLCLFPFEPEFYNAQGVPARYTGHPLADSIALENDAADARRRLGLDPGITTLALLPGSRTSEVSKLAGPLLEAASLLAAKRPDLQFVAPLATDAVRAEFERARTGWTGPPICTTDGGALDAMAAADVVVCASGTATLECLLVNRPMVVVYRLSGMTYATGKALRLVKTQHISLPNLLAGEALVPELIQHEVTGPNIALEVERWLEDGNRRASLRDRFHSLHLELRKDAAASAARAVHELVSGNVA